jgi:hypothetical protein
MSLKQTKAFLVTNLVQHRVGMVWRRGYQEKLKCLQHWRNSPVYQNSIKEHGTRWEGDDAAQAIHLRRYQGYQVSVIVKEIVSCRGFHKNKICF